jgi:hypothetical protein
MKDKILEIAEKLRLELITEDEARNLLLRLFIVNNNENPINMQDLMLFYQYESDFVFNSSISEVIIDMLNKQ